MPQDDAVSAIFATSRRCQGDVEFLWRMAWQGNTRCLDNRRVTLSCRTPHARPIIQSH